MTSTPTPTPAGARAAAGDPSRARRGTRRLVLRHLRPRRGPATALILAVIAATALPLLTPALTREVVDAAIRGADTRRLVLIALAGLAVAVAGQAARMFTAWLASGLAWDGTNRLREHVAAHALHLDLDFHGTHPPGEMIERVDGDVVAVADFVVAFLLDAVGSLLLLVGVLVVVSTVDARLSAVLTAYCLVIGCAMLGAQRLAVPSGLRARQQTAALLGDAEERLIAVEDIRANGAGEHVVRRFQQASWAWYRADRDNDLIGSTILAGTTVAFAAGTALVLVLAAWGRGSGTLTVGTAVLLFQYTIMIRTPFERLMDQLRQLQGALAGVARIGDLLAERPTLPVPTVARPLPETGPLRLELDAVGFAYRDDGERVLSDITVRLAPGETLGLVGRTGSGKTTIARLALRLYDPTEGSVRVGGVDLRDVDPTSTRRRLGIVTQDVQIFAATVRDNVTLFRSVAASGGDERVAAVLAEVGLGDWLAGLPDGLDTALGGAGAHGISAGEAQLLAFARVLLADPGLVVLDEAASRLDPQTERLVDRSIERLLVGRTAILIAHRLASLSRVDRIAVVDHGRIVEQGRRADLAADPQSRFAHLLHTAGVRR